MIANVAIAALLSGIVGTIFYSIMVKRTRKYKLFSIIRKNMIYLRNIWNIFGVCYTDRWSVFSVGGGVSGMSDIFAVWV